MIVNDIIFGKLEYDGYDWIKKDKEVYNFFGRDYKINLKIVGRTFESNEIINQIQKETYINYKNSIKKLNFLIEESIYDFYQEECYEYRKMFEEDADILAPIITHKEELDNLLKLVCILIGNEKNNRVIFFVFDTVWDEEGISIKMVNEKIEIIGGLSEMYIWFFIN